MRIVDAGNNIVADSNEAYEMLLEEREASREHFANLPYERMPRWQRALWMEAEAIDRFERSER